MNKKVQKGLVAAVAATMGAGMVAPVASAAVQTASVSLDAQYKAAYDATQKALQTKTQKDLTAARVLVDSLYNTVKGTGSEYLATTLSTILDPAQQVKLVELFAAINKATASVKQADINAARELILEMPKQWIESFSSAIDTIQEGLIKKVVEAVEKAKTSRLQADFDAASALVTEIATVTNNSGVKTWADAIKTELNKVEVKLAVTAVTATNASTLSITGSGLNRLKAEDITIAGNKVTTLTAAADGKSATAVLEGKIAPDSQVTVNIKEEAGTVAHKVTYGFVITSVSINEESFDDDRLYQSVGFKINGSSVDADLDYLALAGYSVNFVATDKDGNAIAIFANGNTSSPTGELKAPIAVGEYTIQLQLVKSGVAVVSDKKVIKVRNLDGATTTIDSVKFANLKGGSTVYNDNVSTTDDISGNDFLMNSSTLVAGEKMKAYEVRAIIGGEKTLLSKTAFEVTTSNPAVISVDKTTGEYVLTAEAAGTATITVKTGDTTQTYTYTVTNTRRELTNVAFSSSSLNLVKGKDATVRATVTDQYGDPYLTTAANIEEVIPTNAGGTPITAAIEVDFATESTLKQKGQIDLKVTANAKGAGTVYLKDKTTNPSTGVVSNKTIGTLYVNVTDIDNIGSRKLELVNVTGYSTDNTLEKTDDDVVAYRYARYNSNGVYVQNETVVTSGTPAAGQYLVESTNPSIATVSVNATTNRIDITAVAAGTTDIVIKDSVGNIVEKTTITVTNSPYKITSVAFKTVPTIDYAGKNLYLANVLDMEDSQLDDVVKGITLNKATSSKIRIAEVANGNIAVDELYIDMDNDGRASTGDVELGAIVVTQSSDSNFTVAGAGTNYANNKFLTTASPNKGTVIVKVMRNANDVTTSIAATSITINVK